MKPPSPRRSAATWVACGFLFVQSFAILAGLAAASDKNVLDLTATYLSVLFLPSLLAPVLVWRLDWRLAVLLTFVLALVLVVLPSWMIGTRAVKEAFALSLFVFGPAVSMSLSFVLISRSRAATLVVFVVTIPVLALGVAAVLGGWGIDPTRPGGFRPEKGTSAIFIGMSMCCQLPLCVATLLACALVRVSWLVVGPDGERGAEPDSPEYNVELVEEIPVIPVVTKAAPGETPAVEALPPSTETEAEPTSPADKLPGNLSEPPPQQPG